MSGFQHNVRSTLGGSGSRLGNGKVVATKAVDADVPGMCRAQVGCAISVQWRGWGEGWQALQVIDC